MMDPNPLKAAHLNNHVASRYTKNITIIELLSHLTMRYAKLNMHSLIL